MPIVEAECAGPECRNLKQPTRHHHVLQEVDHLILVGKVVVERKCCCEREDSESHGHDTRMIARNEEQTTPEFDGDGHSESERWERQSHSADHSGCGAIGGKLAKAAHS